MARDLTETVYRIVEHGQPEGSYMPASSIFITACAHADHPREGVESALEELVDRGELERHPDEDEYRILV